MKNEIMIHNKLEQYRTKLVAAHSELSSLVNESKSPASYPTDLKNIISLLSRLFEFHDELTKSEQRTYYSRIIELCDKIIIFNKENKHPLSNKVANTVSEIQLMSDILLKGTYRNSNIIDNKDSFEMTIQNSVNQSLSRIKSTSDSILAKAETRYLELEESLKAAETESKRRIELSVRSFKTKEAELENILGGLSAKSMASINLDQAAKEKSSADKMRAYGVLWLACSIIFGMFILNDYTHFLSYKLSTEALDKLNVYSTFIILFPLILLIVAYLCAFSDNRPKKLRIFLRSNFPNIKILYVFTSLFILVSIFFIFFEYVKPIDSEKIKLSMEWFLIRFFTITLITSPGIYLLKESAGHRGKENLYRQRGTQLATIGSYLEALPDEHQHEIKKDLAKNFFSFHNGKADTSSVPDFINDCKELTSALRGMESSKQSYFKRK